MDSDGMMRMKYPKVDFKPYFAFLESLPVYKPKRNANLHRHHIAPKKQFPKLNEGWSGPNILVLKDKNHWKAHRLLEKACSDFLFNPELINFASEAGKKGGRKGGRKGG